MWDGEEGVKAEDERPLTQAPSKVTPTEMTDHRDVPDMSVDMMDGANEEEEEEEEEEDASNLLASAEAQQQIAQRQPDASLGDLERSRSPSSPPQRREQEADTDPDFDPLLDGDPHGDSFPCPHCERHFSTRQGLERHIHIHAVAGQQTQLFKCRYCSKSFGSQVGRRRHERRHESGAKKKPGSLAGTAHLLSPLVQTDISSPDCTSPTGHFAAMGSQYTGGPAHYAEIPRKESGSQADPPFVLDENGASKELHPCKYCNKAFGTHTNMRRHQRRIHERHLLPKGVRRKGMLLQEASEQPRPDASPNTGPALVYLPSVDTEDEADRDDYAVDISKNISENLSFYIDGKIVSTSAVSSCEVIEVDTRSAALFGLDTVIISPSQLSQALKVEARASSGKQVSSFCPPSSKRRTLTPPLVPGLKIEAETVSFTTSSSSAASSSPNLLVGGLIQQAADPSGFQREKTVYLSPKLKQLLQTQDVQKSITLITESPRLASPLCVTPLQGPSGRFKRRTASPPSASQLSPPFRAEGCKAEALSSYTLKVPRPDNLGVFPLGDSPEKDDDDDDDATVNSYASNPGQTSSGDGGTACNQQPLDLSNTVSKRSDTPNKGLSDAALDLSFHRKTVADADLKGSAAPQPQVKKRKPNTSMLEKVLMNEYVGLPLPTDEGPSLPGNVVCQPQSPNVESAHPSPPSLTPVTMNPSSPGTSSVTSTTPPPPVLPTMPSPPPPATADSPLSQPADSSAQRPLPVLSPEMSPRSPQLPSEEAESLFAGDDEDEEEQDLETLDPPNTPLQDPLDHSAPDESPSVGLSVTQDVSPTEASGSLPNGQTNQDLNSGSPKSENSDSAALSPHPESLPTPPSLPVSHDTVPLLLPQSLPPPAKIKEEPEDCADEPPVENHVPQENVDASPPPFERKPGNPPAAEKINSTYSKTFVCNVCDSPFDSMKELGGHIAAHAADWPFKCEFCLQLFGDKDALLAHRTTLHGVGTIFVCSACSKEFAFLCNLQQHQKDLHPNDACTHTSVESGKLRPQNYTDPSRAKEEIAVSAPAQDASEEGPKPNDAKEEPDGNGDRANDGAEDPNEELYTTIKIMASEGGKPKGPDVRLGQNQHYPSYKPPPFPYHSRSHAGSMASATNFTTHNIPQTFTTAIRCTKCGDGFDNMPELHQHILACANASDKKRYTPKKNPIPLKQIVKSPNGVASPSAGQSAFRRMGQPKRLNFNQDLSKTKMSALSKKKNQLVQKAISQKNKTATSAKKAAVKVEEEQTSVCPHCSREFTYQASLSKHMAVSCPMKPAAKKAKKILEDKKKVIVAGADKNMRKKESEAAQTEPELKPLGKTRARSSGAAEPTEPPQATKGKNMQKRPASFPAATPVPGKKAKNQAQASPTHSPGDAATQKQPIRMQRMGKALPKRLAEPKSLSPPQPKKEERFSLRMRERLGGPVTRSSQMAAPAAEAKSEDAPAPELKDAPEMPMK